MVELINNLLGRPLGYLLFFIYTLTKNYGISIILFTLITKIITFPLSLMSQKNSIKMVKMEPELNIIRQRNSDNPNLIMKEQKELFKKENYNSFIGLIPLLIQIPIIMGLMNVIYNPLLHLLHLDSEVIANLFSVANSSLTNANQIDSQLTLVKQIQIYSDTFKNIISSDTLKNILDLNFIFLGLDLAEVPTISGVLVLIPIIAGLSALALSLLQNKYNVLQKEQNDYYKIGMALFLVVFSVYFTFIVPAGVGLYWIAGNIFSILVMFLCNIIYNPKKFIDYENRSETLKLTKDEKKLLKEAKKLEKEKEKIDNKRFFSTKKEIVFYSESSGFYKYLGRIIDYLLDNSELTIHYVTNDYNDKIFENKNPRLEKYYIGNNKLISFMMKIDAEIVVMTMTDLNQYHIKRSIVKPETEYIYVNHSMNSVHLVLREHALDAYDTIFCCGPNQLDEIRALEQINDLPEKKLIEAGYILLDDLLEEVSNMNIESKDKKQILIAPSWQKDNIFEYCIDELLENIFSDDYLIILRPHPEFTKRFPSKMNEIINKYSSRIGDNFKIELDFFTSESIYQSDIVITDWSSIAQEFSYTTKKPSIFINTPMKVMNLNYEKVPFIPLDISIRSEIGVDLDVDNFKDLPNIINDMIENKDSYSKKITEVLEKNIFNIGNSAEISGEYILSSLKEKQN